MKLKKPNIESFKKHPYRTGIAASFFTVLAAAEIMGYYKNATYDLPEASCASPYAVSDTYVDPNANLYLRTYTGFFTRGVIATGNLPDDAYGVQASFKSPASPEGEWKENASDMIKASGLGSVSLKMAVGDGDVQFGVRIIAPEGSPLCQEVPEVAYTELDAKQYYKSHGNLPWPNPVNVLSTL